MAKVLGVDKGWRFDGAPLDEPHRATLLRMRNGREAQLVTQQLGAFLRGRDAQLKRQFRRIPPGPASLYAIGPRRELLGRPVSELAIDAAPAGGHVDGAALYRSVDRRKRVLPAYVTGELDSASPGQALAVAVNGTIRATAAAYRVGGEVRFSAIVPPTSFRQGANSVEVLAAEGGRLRPLARVG